MIMFLIMESRSISKHLLKSLVGRKLIIETFQRHMVLKRVRRRTTSVTVSGNEKQRFELLTRTNMANRNQMDRGRG